MTKRSIYISTFCGRVFLRKINLWENINLRKKLRLIKLAFDVMRVCVYVSRCSVKDKFRGRNEDWQKSNTKYLSGVMRYQGKNFYYIFFESFNVFKIFSFHLTFHYHSALFRNEKWWRTWSVAFGDFILIKCWGFP